MRELTFTTQEALAAWLAANDVDTAVWTPPNHKRLVDLWHEYVGGEISFSADPPTRSVAVVQVVLVQNGQRLVELAQEMGNGRVRHRNRPPSDKMKPDEHPTDAAARCLQEEVGLRPDQFQLDPTSLTRETRLTDSPSYPGLQTRYQTHTLHATTSSLPTTTFWRDNAAFGPGDPVRRHQWGWQRPG